MKVTLKQWRLFVRLCQSAAGKLGLMDTRIRYLFKLPNGCPEGVEAGSLSLGAAKKAVIFLNPRQGAELTDKDICYIALHETLELVLNQRLKSLYVAAVDKPDYDGWERATHEVVHRVINLIDEGLMVKHG